MHHVNIMPTCCVGLFLRINITVVLSNGDISGYWETTKSHRISYAYPNEFLGLFAFIACQCVYIV